MNRHAIAALVALGLVLGPARAHADGDKAAAEALFTEAKRLMAEGNYDGACPKLAESQRLDAGGGTLLNLALCHEKQGKTATAWSEFKEALAVAKRDRREDRIAFAQQHVEQLQPMLSRLQIDVVKEQAAPGLVVEVDGREVGRPSWGLSLPIDPGEHHVVARADGYLPWEATITVAADADQQKVSIPALEVDPTAAANEPPATPRPAAPAPPARATRPPEGPNIQRIAGYAVGGLGLVSVAIGTGFGVRAINLDKDADALCPEQEQCPATPDGERAVALSGKARTSATLANGFIGAGVGLVAAGLVVVLTASTDSEGGDSARAVFPILGPGQAGLGMQMKW